MVICRLSHKETGKFFTFEARGETEQHALQNLLKLIKKKLGKRGNLGHAKLVPEYFVKGN
jgi:hypothetical protein